MTGCVTTIGSSRSWLAEERLAVRAQRAAEERDRAGCSAQPRQGTGDVVSLAAHDLAHAPAANVFARLPGGDRQRLVETGV